MATLATSPLVSEVDEFDLNSDSTWKKLYPLLQSFARYFVYSSNIPCWWGQENDIIEDIVQETGRRIIERSQKAARGEALPIQSLRSMLSAVAHNYCKDLYRHDRRLIRIQSKDTALQAYLNRKNQVDLAEAGIDNVYQEVLFKMVAREVCAFPCKQRRAILIDLASRMHFDKRPTPLQQAFLDAGIDLQEYKQALPSDPQERDRHIALVSCAYKRVTNLRQVCEYTALA